MNRLERIERIKKNIPIKFFFERLYEDCAYSSVILADIKLDYSKSDFSNIFNCSPILKRDQEFHLFRKLNYLKYRLIKNTIGFEKSDEELSPLPRRATNLDRIQEKRISELESLLFRIQEVRNLILQANTRLIVKPVSRNFPLDSIDGEEFISNGCFHLMKAIDAFDHRRGLKFSTYCIMVLKKNLYKDRLKLNKNNSYLEDNNLIDFAPQKVFTLSELNIEYSKNLVNKIFEHLESLKSKNSKYDVVEILKMNFGIGCDAHKQKEIAKKVGKTRQYLHKIIHDAYDRVRHFDYDPVEYSV